MHQFLVDENIPKQVVRALRSLGYLVYWVVETGRRESDAPLLERAIQQGLVLITNDWDFETRAPEAPRGARCGVVLTDLHGLKPLQKAARIVEYAQSCVELRGFLHILHSQGATTIALRPE